MARVASQWIFLGASACLRDCVVGSLKRNASRTMLVSRTSRRASLASGKTGSEHMLENWGRITGKIGVRSPGAKRTCALTPIFRTPIFQPHFPGDHVKAEQAALDR